jgi:hypothetical protein
MTVEDLIAALEWMPQSYPVSAGICPDTRCVDDYLSVYESWNFLVSDVRLVGGEVVLA